MTNHFSFLGGTEGQWHVTSIATVVGASIEAVRRIDMVNASIGNVPDGNKWVLRGFTSNVRYAERHEMTALRAKQEGLNRPGSRCAALIPIKKSAEWWAMPQDERRAIFEEQSHHTEIGIAYLPDIARQLHHSRDLGEPFDFLTWFEFAPEHTDSFNKLLIQLRASREWHYVEREIDIRLTLQPP
jgi:chlorite dismutase